MSSKENPSTSWWPKRMLTNWSNSSSNRQTVKTSLKQSSSEVSLKSNNDSINTSVDNRSESSVSLQSVSVQSVGLQSVGLQSVALQSVGLIISGLSTQSPDLETSNKYLNLFMKRIRNRLKMSGSDGSSRQYWMPDSNSKECYECGEKFTALRRRHHCRICGQIFCTKCCNQEIDGKTIDQNNRGYVRACNYCHKIVMSYISDRNNDTNLNSGVNRDAEFSQFRQILLSKTVGDNNSDQIDSPFQSKTDEQVLNNLLLPQTSNAGLSHSTSFKRKSSVGFREEDYAKPKTRVLDIDNEVNQFGSPSMHTLSSFNSYKTPTKTANSSVAELLTPRNDESSHEPLWVKEINEEGDEIPTDEKQELSSSSEIVEILNDFIIPETELGSTHSSASSSSRRLNYSTSTTFDIELDFEKDRVSISKANKTNETLPNQEPKEIKKNISDEGLNNGEFVVTTTSSNWESLKEGTEEKMAYDALNSAYNNLYNRLLTQLLEDEGLSLSWLNVIQKISSKVSSVVRPNSRNDLEEMDIRNYVKIKTIPNGIKNDCYITNGVVFSKNVAHRKMRQIIIHPKILLLSCPIVYQRTEKKLTFLDPLLLQENEYIKNMIAKICSYEPDLILVEKTVARIAQELLLENNITLVCNVKPIILERISRFTGAAIVSSLVAQIGVPQLGICQKFYLQTLNQKTLMFFDGCPQHLGCTILIRGGPLEELKKIKSICSFMVFCDFNWQLERSFLMDEYSLPPVADQILQQSIDGNSLNSNLSNSPRKERSFGSTIIDDNSDPLRSMATDTNMREVSSPIDQQNHNIEDNSLDLNRKMSQFLSKLQLSCSPFITFPMPYLMTTEGTKSKLRKYFSPKLVWSKKFEIDSSQSSELFKVENSINLRNREQSSPTQTFDVKKHPFLTRDLKSRANSQEVKSLVADFRARGPYLMNAQKLPKEPKVKPNDESLNNKIELKKPQHIDALNPKYHQHLPVLFSSFSYASTNAPNYCVKPWVINMDFYGSNDIPLGGFLERYCFCSTYSCPSSSCSTPMIEHVRRFVHSKGCILIVLRQLQQNVEAAQSSIITWSWCQRCKTGTPYSNLSSDSWSLSFAKYLELKFYGSNYRRRATSSSVSCLEHSLHKDHFQFFAYKQVVASFKYSPIVLHEIALPPTLISININSFFRQSFIENLKQIAVRGYEIYSLILEKLCSIKNETSGTKYEIIINEFMAIETRERGEFRQKIEEIQLLLTSPNETFNNMKIYKLEDSLIHLKKFIAESVCNWNLKIQEFFNNKKKDEKISAKSGIQTNNLNIQPKPSSISSAQLEEQIPVNPLNDCSHVLEEANINSRTLSISSASSLLSTIETAKCDIEFKACIQEQEKECQQTLEALEHMSVKDSVEENIDDFVPIKDSSLSVSSYGYEVDIGINTCLGSGVDFGTDSDNYAVYNILESSDESNKPEDSQSIRSLANACDTSKPVINTTQSVGVKADSTPFTVKRIFRELLTNANNLTIDIPFSLSEHYLLPTLKENIAVIVKDDDPGSIIAYALTSSDYDRQLAEISRFSSSPSVKRKLTSSTELENISDSTAPKSSSNSTSQHIDLQYSDTTTKFYCCVYYAERFRKFRANILDSSYGEELYIRSLTNCIPWKARGGKSGSTFCKTVNDRFILKEMSKPELQSFLTIANYYFDYYTRAISESRPTLLAKIVGVYRTSYKNSATNNASKLYLLVMENLFYNCNISQKFDLKGSMRNRLVDTNSSDLTSDQIVLLDENLLKMTCDCPLYIESHSKAILRAAIDNDSRFLSSHSVMDYSLLVGIDDQHSQFVVGIIDYIRPFTWDKKIESVVKSVGSQGKLPTIVQPDLYRIRFCEAMDQYFLCVPDKWFSIVNLNSV